EPSAQIAAVREAGELLERVGIEGARLDGGASLRADVRGDDVCLLDRDAARLDREGRAVADRPHAVEPSHPAVLVDLDEPVVAGRYPGYRAAAQLGQREHAVDLEALPGRAQHDGGSVAGLDPGAGRRDDVHSGQPALGGEPFDEPWA